MAGGNRAEFVMRISRYSFCFPSFLSPVSPLLPHPLSLATDLFVKLFATVPDPQHHYDTGCLDEESWGMDRVTDYGS